MEELAVDGVNGTEDIVRDVLINGMIGREAELAMWLPDMSWLGILGLAACLHVQLSGDGERLWPMTVSSAQAFAKDTLPSRPVAVVSWGTNDVCSLLGKSAWAFSIGVRGKGVSMAF